MLAVAMFPTTATTGLATAAPLAKPVDEITDVVIEPVSEPRPLPATAFVPAAPPADNVIVTMPEEATVLASQILASEASPLLTNIDEPHVTLFTTRFTIGSTREEVLAAQGYDPTYTTRDRRSLWWGSSKVTFSQDGKVISWTDGLPPLMARR